MGQKIDQLGWRSSSDFQKHSIELTSSPSDFRRRFFKELELRRCLGLSTHANHTSFHSINISQTLESGLVLHIKTLVTTPEHRGLTFRKRRQPRLLKRSNRVRGQCRRKQFLRFYTIKLERKGLNGFRNLASEIYKIKKSVEQVNERKKGTVLIISNPVLTLLYSSSFLMLLSALYQTTFRYRNQQYYRLTLFFSLVNFFLQDSCQFYTSFLAKALLRTRKHSTTLRFYKSALESCFEASKSLSNVVGLHLELSGRFDKRPRAQKLSLLKGSVRRQTLSGRVEAGKASAITKNGTFGILFLIRRKK